MHRKTRRPRRSDLFTDESSESRFDDWDIEVYEKGGIEVRQLEVGDDLSLVDGEEKLDRFDLDDDPLVDERSMR